MRKSAKDLITSLVVVIVMAALVGFFGWATNGFKNVNRFKQWFGMAQTELDKLVDGDNSVEMTEAVTKVKSSSAGIQHDSDDTVYSTDIQRCNAPRISMIESKYVNNDTGIYIDLYYGGNAEAVHGKECTVYISEQFTHVWGTTYGEKKLYRTFSYGAIESNYPAVSEHSLIITREDIMKFFSESFASGNSAVFRIEAKSLAYDSYLDSDTVYYSFYVDATDSPDTFEIEGTTLKIGKCSLDSVPDEIVEIYSDLIDVKIGKANYNGKFFYLSAPMISRYNYNLSSGMEYYPSAFSEDDDYVYCDLTKLPFVDSVGDYAVFFTHNAYALSVASTGGATEVLSVPVLRNYSTKGFSISKMAAPTDVRLFDGNLTWEYNNVAENGFAVFDGDSLLATVDDAELNLNDYNLEEGEHTFRIRALGNVGSSLAGTAKMTAFNAGSNIAQLVALTYYIGDDVVTKFVPLGKNIGDYLYDVDVDGVVFGGWYKDAGYSVIVDPMDKLTGDVAVYARLSAIETTDRPVTWWDKNMWYILGPIIGIFAVSVIAVVIKVVRDRRAA